MGQRQLKIRTKSYIHLPHENNAPIYLCNLSNYQKDYLGALLHTKFLNSLYVGKVQFCAEDMPTTKDVFPAVCHRE